MSMTEKDYETVAGVIRTEYTLLQELDDPRGGGYGWAMESFATRLANELEHDNPEFKRDRFLKDCGVKE